MSRATLSVTGNLLTFGLDREWAQLIVRPGVGSVIFQALAGPVILATSALEGDTDLDAPSKFIIEDGQALRLFVNPLLTNTFYMARTNVPPGTAVTVHPEPPRDLTTTTMLASIMERLCGVCQSMTGLDCDGNCKGGQ